MELFRFDQGVVTSRDPGSLEPGEMVQATGAFYKKGDTSSLHVAPSRAEFGDTGSGLPIKAVSVIEHDGQSPVLLAYTGNTIYKATAGASGSFSSLITGLNASATRLSVCHANDDFFLGNGYDRNHVIESDGTTRRHGMVPPDELPVATPTTATGTKAFPSATPIANSGWSNPANARDNDLVSYAHASLTAAGSSSCTWGNWPSRSAGNRVLKINYLLSRHDRDKIQDEADFDHGIGGTAEAGFDVTIKIERSTNAGSSFTTLKQRRLKGRLDGGRLVSPITVNDDQVQVRATLTYHAGGAIASFQIAEIAIVADSDSPTLSGTFFYKIAEFDQDHGLLSIPGPTSAQVTLTAASGHNGVSLTLPSARNNTNTTEWWIYRTTAGATDDLLNFGRIAEVPYDAAVTTFADTFEVGANTLPANRIPLIPVESPDRTTTLYFYRDKEPPAATYMTAWKGSIVLISRDFPRALFSSVSGRPDSFPEINLIANFPFPEHDSLVAAVVVGESLLIGARGLMLRLDDLPRVISGVFNASEVHPLRGAPGLVGQYAIASLSVGGEPRAAWVSPFGVELTDGFTWKRLSLDIDWENTVNVSALDQASLTWDPEQALLVFDYPRLGSTVNDERALIHVSPEHAKPNGLPKWTLPHAPSAAATVSAVVSSMHRFYEGSTTDGKVYVRGGVASAQTIKTGRRYLERLEVGVSRGALYHSDFGAGKTCSLTWDAGRDSADTQSLTQTVEVSGRRYTEFYVGRAGDWHQITIAHSPTITGSFRAVDAILIGGSPAGAAVVK